MTREKKIQERYMAGISVSDIAKEEGLSREMVYKYLRRMLNWDKKLVEMKAIRYYQRLNKKYSSRIRKIINMRKRGFSTSKVSKMLNIPFPAVVEILKGTTFDNSKEVRASRNEKICKAYQEGKSQTYLSKAFGLTQSRISAIIKQWESSRKTLK